jgi:hypothetical protein
MIRNLIPWTELTRTGIPALKVCRRPMVLGEVTIAVGEALDPEVFPLQIRKQRLRQFYEARLLEPVNPLPTSLQFYRERQLARQEVPIAPITPVATRIVAEDLPAVEVPVETDDAPKRRPKGAK